MMKTLLGIGFLCAAALASACNGPMLQNVPVSIPKPNPTVIAGAAAATATAITLASPDSQARRVAAEDAARRPEGRALPTRGQTAPADVLDRLDAAQRNPAAPSSLTIYQVPQDLVPPPLPGATPYFPAGLPPIRVPDLPPPSRP